ncbi:chemotaxis protein CheA [Desulfobaculum bizertense]|uniref:histidine kinase n=1 Tax=Desulfobaculum bizertense DSM 18034 TaxID=1121442 RepID=A0A1T4VTA3_9BACT|nr:chemotaxis protein CheW [Desulfobaculum bizertense]SKA68186.1 two-component system, chemotaxis family, sensor kinase CheA [Desulfobaculum bizertense DSM 18034]
MKKSIEACLESLEAEILSLESGKTNPVQVKSVLEHLGLSQVRYADTSVSTLMDMLQDGIAPVSPDMVTALLRMTDGQRLLLYSMAGVVETRAEKIQKLRATGEYIDPAVQAEMKGQGEDKKEQGAERTPEKKRSSAAVQNGAEQAGAGAKVQPGKQPLKAQSTEIASIRVGTDKLDSLIEYVGKLMTQYAVIAQNSSLDAKAVAGMKELESVIGHIKEEVEKIRLVPLKQIFTPIHRLVSSLTLKMEKKVHFEVLGDDLELDKTIVEHINEPLVHLLRNAVDHGLESSSERVAAGKSEEGQLTLSARRENGKAILAVRDDGRGLDPERIRQKAIDRGLLTPEEGLTDEEIFQYILESGFSTAEKVTDISGRGVGMDAVVHSIRGRLGGDIRIQSEKGRGSLFELEIPLERSLSEGILDALIVQMREEIFVVPSQSVLEVYAVSPQELSTMPSGDETVDVRGELYPLFRLDEYFGLESVRGKSFQAGDVQAVVIRVGKKKAAFLVDDVLRQQQVVVAGFTIPVKEIYQVPILGYGMIGERDALVLDVEALFEEIG